MLLPCFEQRRGFDLRLRQPLRWFQRGGANKRAQIGAKWLSASFKFEAFVEEIRGIELGPADQLNGVMSPLPHAPDLWDSHGEEDKAFKPFGAFGNSFGVKDAF